MEERTQFTMRIDTQLWNRLKVIATINKRSAAKEVEFAIEQYVNNFIAKNKDNIFIDMLTVNEKYADEGNKALDKMQKPSKSA